MHPCDRPQSTWDSSEDTDLAIWWEDNLIVGPHNGAGKLAEDDGLLGHGHILFFAVVHIIHAHTHHFVWPRDRGQQGHL
jgi:hypothetical protein